MTYLLDLVEPLMREVSVPGAFAVDFPSTTEDDLEAALGDGFANAQLDGFFPSLKLDLDSLEITPDLSVAGGALVVLYAGTRMIRQRLRNIAGVSRRYKAGPVEAETTVAVSLLVQDLKDLQNRLNNLIVSTSRSALPTAVYTIDGYFARMASPGLLGGLNAAELPVSGVLALRGA